MIITEQQRQIINITEEKLNQYIVITEQKHQVISIIEGKLNKYIELFIYLFKLSTKHRFSFTKEGNL